MISTIPDKPYKLFLLLSIFIVWFCFNKRIELANDLENKNEVYFNLLDSIGVKKYESEFLENKLKNDCKYLADSFLEYKFYKIENNEIGFNHFYVSDDKDFNIELKKLSKDFDKIELLKHELNILQLKSNLNRQSLNSYKLSYNSFDFSYIIGISFGIAILILSMVKYFNDSENILEKNYINCQSCGNKFSSMVMYGKYSDGKYNKAFCDKCYNNGEFIDPDFNINQYIIKQSKNNLFRKFKLKIRYAKLERWRKKIQ